MGYRAILFQFFSFILCWEHIHGVPVPAGVDEIQIATVYLPSYATVLISLGALLLIAYFVLGCVCCPNKSIKALSYQNGFPVSRLNENAFENPTEITIFPPHSTVIDLQPVSPSFPGFNDKVTFEPLPDILPKKFTTGQSAACSSRPAHFSALLKNKVSLHDWFDDPNSNFPREQLQYLQEIGCGWFGRIVEGEAAQICENEDKTSVIVKILREEASPSEHLHFLHEVRPYRDLKHPNVTQLLGRCLESDPFLLIMEHSIFDLKTFLIKQDNRDSLMKDDLVLQMVSNIASGLRYMHDKGFCHMDLAAHNCFVCKDNVVKIGDYGISFDRWKGDYYCLGDIALPIRWYSPEILHCSETTIETRDITKEANVWAFGVVLWEIVQFGKLPYEEFSDEEVLQKVLIEKSVQLNPSTSEIPYKDEISLVMRECWKPKKYRPSMEKIESFITQFCSDKLSIKTKELSFEERWNSIHPRITEISSYTGTESSSFKFENDFSTRSDLQNYSSDNEILSSFEMSFDMLPKTEFSAQLSPSLNVLNGSIDELTENDVYLNSISLSCGKYDADTLSNISDKENFQMEEDKDNLQSTNMISEQISAAIRDLDLVLANQPDSSRNSTLQKSIKPVFNDAEVIENDKEFYVNGVSDLSNISENSYSKSSNLSEHLDPVMNGRYEDLSNNSDLNGNCSFYNSNLNSNRVKDIAIVTSVSKIEKQDKESIVFGDHIGINIKSSKNVDDKVSVVESCNGHQDVEITSNGNKQLSPVPDIVIHESPSVNGNEISDEISESENNQSDSCNQKSQKIFRFVFRDPSNQDHAEMSHQEFSNELNHDIMESLKRADCSKPLTSTPVKSSSDAFSPVLCFDNSQDIKKNGISNDVFYVTDSAFSTEDSNVDKKILEKSFEANPVINGHIEESQDKSDCKSNLHYNVQSQSTVNSTGLEHFTTAQSSLGFTENDKSVDKISEKSILNEKTMFQTDNIVISCNGQLDEVSDPSIENCNNSNNLYISAENGVKIKDGISKVLADVISPPNGYVSSNKTEIVINYADSDNDIENEYFEDSKASETVSPPQGFQDNGLPISNDSFSESKTSFDQDFSTSAECGSSENLEQYLEDDHVSQTNTSAAKLLETSFPEVASESFTFETYANCSGNMRPRKNGSSFSSTDSDKKISSVYNSDYAHNGYQNSDLCGNHRKPHFRSYDQMIVEDLDTGEQTIINESYSVCDDYENSAESDEILKINTETDEAIIVDSSEALIGFVPSRSIELLQEFEVIPQMNPSYVLEEERESSDSMNLDAYNSASPSPAAMRHNSSPYESPESTFPQQPYRNFCLQNQVIEEEITDEIVSPSSFHSSSSYCSNEIFLDEEKMSQSSESPRHGEMYETSVLPSVDHLYVSDDGCKTDVSSSDCSPVKENEIVNVKYQRDEDNNHISDDQEDVMHSYQPTQSVRWLSDDTLDVERDGQSPIIIEGREILAGDIMQTCELTAEDIASALSQLEAKGHLHGLNPNRLSVSPSPSPYSSVESSPCRDNVYTPDFESDTEETNSGTSCSSTSGSFECIHNKFKNTVDISTVPDESDKSLSSREQSPMKIFSRTWDCHATPTRGVLVTPEKKFNSMRKSVSFHEEDPQVVFEYPPASDSSEDEYPSDDNQEFCQNIDYLKYADWDLQVGDADDIDAEEIVEIEELDSEPYVRRPPYSSSSVGPLNRPMLYTLTSGFSDEDFDSLEALPPPSCHAPSNSPDEKEIASVSSSRISELIQSHLNNLVQEENKKLAEAAVHSHQDAESLPDPVLSVQESVVSSVEVEDIVIDELLQESIKKCESAAVHKEEHTKIDSEDDDMEEEIIVEELEEDSESESDECEEENQLIVPETDLITCPEKILDAELPINILEIAEKNSSKMEYVEDLEISPSEVSVPLSSLEPSQISKQTETPPENFSKESEAFSNELNQVINDENKLDALDSENALNKVLEINHLAKTNIHVKPVSEEDNASVNETSSPKHILINLEDDCTKKVNSTDDRAMDCKNKDISNFDTGCHNIDDTKSNVFQIPVQLLPCEPESDEKCAIDILNESSCVSGNECEILPECKKIINDSEILSMPAQTDLGLTKESVEEIDHPSPCNSVMNSDSATKTIDSICSTDSDLSVHENKSECTDILLNNKNLPNVVYQSNTVFSTSNIEHNSNTSHENAATSENNHISTTSENDAKGEMLLKDSSSRISTNPPEIFSSEFIGEKGADEYDRTSCSDENKSAHFAPSNDLLLTVTTEPAVSKGSESDNGIPHPNTDSLLHVPKIIVTPASGSEDEDELEEYLIGQLQHFHSEASPQEDFSVTSEFSCRPFNDVFGSYISGDSSEYIEAFNFEFENGNFYEDFVDYPLDLQTDMNERLCPDDGRQKRSSSLPLMTENLSDDDSLTIKSDSSLVYDSSKGVTHL